MRTTGLAPLTLEDLYERLEDIERRASAGISMTTMIGPRRVARDYTDKDNNQHRHHNRNLASWLRAYIEKRIKDEQH